MGRAGKSCECGQRQWSIILTADSVAVVAWCCGNIVLRFEMAKVAKTR